MTIKHGSLFLYEQLAIGEKFTDDFPSSFLSDSNGIQTSRLLVLDSRYDPYFMYAYKPYGSSQNNLSLHDKLRNRSPLISSDALHDQSE